MVRVSRSVRDLAYKVLAIREKTLKGIANNKNKIHNNFILL